MDCADDPCGSPSAPEIPDVERQQLSDNIKLRERNLDRQSKIVVEQKVKESEIINLAF